jgi:ribonuclease-3 family protein
LEIWFDRLGQLIGKDGQPTPPAQMSPLVWAYVGDSVYDLFVRSFLVGRYPENAHNLHVRSIGFVSAQAQAQALDELYPFLTEEEQGVFRRGRNAKPGTVPKNASIRDYHNATGLEALFGWLYLCGKTDRLGELMTLAVEKKLQRGAE